MNVCDRCGFPAVERDGRWEHASYADGVFCAIVMTVLPDGTVSVPDSGGVAFNLGEHAADA